MNHWIFSNKVEGRYEDSDWDTSTILQKNRYYFKASESNRAKVSPGDTVFLREYGAGLWGECVVGDWVDDPDAKKKHNNDAGWFPITSIKKWDVKLPYELIKDDLSNQNHRLRIAKATEKDRDLISIALRFYRRLGYGSVDGDFLVLESGIEEAVKRNLKQLGLRLADESIQQQCDMGFGVGRSDLICLDKDENYVVLELKSVNGSDYVVGQILRYMGYIRENWAGREGKNVSGIILVPDYDEQLRLAAKEAGIRVMRIRI